MGFTTDYMVATWVGNLLGEPMRQISGVSGAAPLWQRIMLHLHEQKTPDPFPPMTAWIKKPICSISGQKPSANCPTVVEEYLLPADLAVYERSAAVPFQLPPVYDEWLASQPESAWVAGELRILVPQEDAYFVVEKTVVEKTALAASRLAF